MIKTNIILALRSLLKEKGFTFINTIGLAIGLACFLLIMIFVMHEYSYENHIKDADNIYRIYEKGDLSSEAVDKKQGFLPFPMAKYLVENYPEIEKIATVGNTGGLVVTYKENGFQDWRGLIADTNFFGMFPTEFIAGNPKTALAGKNKLVLTEESAKKWFGDEDPMGKMMRLGNFEDLFEVTAVVKNPPTNTHMKYTMLISERSIGSSDPNSWYMTKFRFMYIKLKENVNVFAFEERLQKIYTEKFEPEFIRLTGTTFKEALAGNPMIEMHLQNIKGIYLDALLNMEIGGVSGNKTLVNIALIIAFALLFLACVNYINLSTARFANRMKEICVKKTLGATKQILFGQFFSEAYVITFISILIALALTELTMNAFCEMLMLEYSISIYQLPFFWPFLITVFVVVGFLSGSYPAIVMSKTGITEGLRSSKSTSNRGAKLRKALVLMQFGISFTILLGAFVVTNQIEFMLKDTKGISTDNILILHNIPDIPTEKQQTLKQEIQKLSGVVSTSYTNIYPSEYPYKTNFWKEDDTAKRNIEFIFNLSEADFIKTMDIQLLEGDLWPDNERDTLTVLINETAQRMLGWENPIGKRLVSFSGNQDDPYYYFTIRGVVKDYNIEPMHQLIRPVVISTAASGYQNLLVKLDDNYSSTLAEDINEIWKKLSNGNSLSTENMDEVLNWLYRKELSAQQIVNVFSIISIIIAALGLLGLVSYSSLRKTKEIGIRKANGARVDQILLVLSKETLLLLGVAIVIFTPIAILIINSWLNGFAYKVSVGVNDVALSIIILLLIAIVSELTITLRAARQNPVKSLRYE